MTGGRRRNQVTGSWHNVIEDVQAIPMVIADETGEVSIDAREANLELKASAKERNMFQKLPQGLEESLRDRYKIVTKGLFLAKQMRYIETVITEDTEVFVVGDCEVKDGHAAFCKRSNPLLLSSRKEEEVVKLRKIMTRLTTIAGVAVPVVCALIAGYIFWSLAGLGGPRNQPGASARQNSGKDNGKAASVSQAIAKLKSSNASLSDRAWAARKLAEAPVENGLVGEVAPLLNPLLESKDGFQRDSALLAIKHGWGSLDNEPILVRVAMNTKDARVQKEVTEVVKRLRN
jgi:hypothetical protein